MLKHFTSDCDFLAFLDSEKYRLSQSDLNRLSSSKDFKVALFKVKKAAVDLIRDQISALYSHFGRPADDPAVLIRSFILKQHFGYVSIKKWCEFVQSDPLIRFLIGSWDVPGFATHYDFIIRLTGRDPHPGKELEIPNLFKKANKDRLRKGEKWVNFTDDDVRSLCDRYLSDPSADSDRTLYTLQSLMNSLVVTVSADLGLIPDSGLKVAGDGTCLHVHASPNGHKADKTITDNDTPNIRYSCIDGDWGWDSDLEKWYFGFTLFNISCHNPDLKVDLPLFLTLVKASQHDSLTAVSAFAQFMDMNPALHPTYALFDSAMDALPFYSFLYKNHVIPIIDQNKRSTSDKKKQLDGNGAPICDAGFSMIPFGYDKSRYRIKYRCPLALGKIDHCPREEQCRTSDYGKTAYVKTLDSPRDNLPVPYRSDRWKAIYNDRTCTERINTRILNDYKQHSTYVREGAKHAFITIFNAINIHMDAWYKLESK